MNTGADAHNKVDVRTQIIPLFRLSLMFLVFYPFIFFLLNTQHNNIVETPFTGQRRKNALFVTHLGRCSQRSRKSGLVRIDRADNIFGIGDGDFLAGVDNEKIFAQPLAFNQHLYQP